MGPNEEEGCLTFKKGTVINVLRRVDQNWAEGRIATSIGIFPIAFVELNNLAKQVLDTFTTSSAATTAQVAKKVKESSRNLPPIPSVLDSQSNSTGSNSATTSPSSPSSSSSSAVTASSVTRTDNVYSSNSSGTTPNPISATTVNNQTNTNNSSASSTSSNSTSFHSMPNSPQNSMPTTPQHVALLNTGTGGEAASSSVRMRNSNDLKHKRHSLNALLSNGTSGAGASLSILKSNRHSAEILSVPNDFEENEAASARSLSDSHQISTARESNINTSDLPTQASATILSDQQRVQLVQHQTISSTSSLNSQQQPSRHNVLKTCIQQTNAATLPWGYLALYPYKPRKNDELELKKGIL